MPEKILFLGGKESRQGHESPELFRKYMPDLMPNDNLEFACFDELQFFCSKEKVTIILGGQDIKTFDRIFMFGWFANYRDIAYAVAYYANWQKVKLLNTEALHQRSSGKVSQAVIFGLNKLSIPKTAFSIFAHEEFLEKASDWLGGYPLIAKQFNGNKGSNNFLAKDNKNLNEILHERAPGVAMVLQEFIENDGDMRVLVVYGKTSLILHRRNENASTHLHNISLGAKGLHRSTDYLPESLKSELAIASKLMHRELSGMDVIESIQTGKFYILESNNMPQLASSVYYEQHLPVLVKAIKHLK